MMAARFVALALAVCLIPGCGTTGSGGTVTPPSPADVQAKCQALVFGGLDAITIAAPDKKAAVVAYAQEAEASIKADLIPWFTNTPLAAITASTAQDILSKFEGKIPPAVAAEVGAAVTLATVLVPFPANPTSGIDPNTQACILAALNGSVGGIDEYVAANSSAAPPTAKKAKKIIINTAKR